MYTSSRQPKSGSPNPIRPTSSSSSSATISSSGFTLIELIVVIVVIAILAAISIVAYTGIQQRATSTKMQAELSQVKRSSEIEKTLSAASTYPSTFPANTQGSVNTDSTIISNYYPRANGTGFCADSYSTRYTDLTFHVTNTAGIVQPGLCTENPYIPPQGGGTPPVATTESCFAFNSATRTITNYYDHEHNDTANPACPRDVVIPSTIGGVEVEVIGGTSLRDKSLTAVAVADSVIEIQAYAFTNNHLTSVSIGGSVESIGYSAFGGNSLVSVTIPDSVTYIEAYAFSNAFNNASQSNSVVIGNGVTRIGGSAFQSNELASITLGNSVAIIEQRAFTANRLTSVDIPDSVTEIWYSAFQNNQITEVSLPGYTMIDESLNPSFDHSVTITRR